VYEDIGRALRAVARSYQSASEASQGGSAKRRSRATRR